VIGGENKADTVTFWLTEYAVRTYGGDSDLWGLTLSPAEVNAVDFGVVLSAAYFDFDQARIDDISITVHYLS
jgi:hypothetical protein